MIGALVIVFREVIEAGLIIGVVLAATRGIPGRGWWVTLGVIAGVIGAGIVAAFAESIANAFQGSGQEVLNAAILLVAVVMLVWTVVWMAQHGRELTQQLKAVGKEVGAGQRSLLALAVVVGTAVLREGSEIVLFLYGIAAGGGTSAAGLLTGGALGLLAGAAVSALSYLGIMVIPIRYVFSVTKWLITLLAAGMAARAVNFLDQAGVLTALDWTVWDTSAVLSDDSIAGRVVSTLTGYTAQPTAMQLVAYFATILIVLALTRIASAPRPPVAAAKPA